MSRQGPTKGAIESTNEVQRWSSSRAMGLTIRVLVFLAPLAVGYLALRLIGPALWHPSGLTGTVVWLAQAAVVAAALAFLVERASRRVLPLATLFELSMVFPDQAPSRFSISLRTGTLRKLSQKVAEEGLGATEAEAARNGIALVAALSSHDRLTRGHTERVRAYSDLIAAQLDMLDVDREKLAWGALLHDVGKLTVPPEILNKNGRPTDEEWAILRNHPAASRELLEPLADWLGPMIGAAAEHHERWDGDGYPDGLAGNDISLAGRIVAVADAYDVITSKRSYKRPMSAAAARAELVRCSGTQFDPVIVRAFLNASVGRRWLTGPLGGLLALPLAQIGAAVASTPSAVAIGSALAISAISAASPPIPDDLAFVTAADDTASSSDDRPTDASTPASTETSTSERRSDPTLPPTTASTAPSTTALTPSTGSSTTSSNPTSSEPTTSSPTTPVTTTSSSMTPVATTPASTTSVTTAPTSTTASAGPPPGPDHVRHLAAPPASTASGTLQSDSVMTTFDDGGPVVLQAPLHLHLPPLGAPVPFTIEHLEAVTIPAGTTVCARFVHFDPVTPTTVITSTIRVPGAIVAVASPFSTLLDTHFLANGAYPADYDGFGKTDSVRRVDDSTIEVTGWEEGNRDQMRVLYRC